MNNIKLAEKMTVDVQCKIFKMCAPSMEFWETTRKQT